MSASMRYLESVKVFKKCKTSSLNIENPKNFEIKLDLTRC